MWSVATTSGHLSQVGHRASPRLVPDGERLILRLEVDDDDRRAIVEICGDQLDIDCGNHLVSMVLPPDVGPDAVEATLYGTSLEISLPWSHGLLPTAHELEGAANAAKLALRRSLCDAARSRGSVRVRWAHSLGWSLHVEPSRPERCHLIGHFRGPSGLRTPPTRSCS